MNEIDWSKQHNGIHQGSISDVINLMPDVGQLILRTFEGDENDFIWDIKVHMLMPNQYPCIPNWHFDNVPRVNNAQDFSKVQADKPMYLWMSNAPLTEFRKNGKSWHIKPNKWIKFTQEDEHRGSMATTFCWRGFIRATHKDIIPMCKVGSSPLRRHSQVYLDSNNFSW